MRSRSILLGIIGHAREEFIDHHAYDHDIFGDDDFGIRGELHPPVTELRLAKFDGIGVRSERGRT